MRDFFEWLLTDAPIWVQLTAYIWIVITLMAWLALVIILNSWVLLVALITLSGYLVWAEYKHSKGGDQ